MKPLNLRNYIFINIKQVIPQITLLSVKIALFIFICSIGFAVMYGLKKDSTLLLDSYASIRFNEDVKEENRINLINIINNIEGVETDFEGVAITEGFGKLIIFNSFCWTFQTNNIDDAKYILNSIDGKIIQGRLPNKANEIMISEELSKNIEKSVGDYVGYEELLTNKYVVTGVFNGEHNAYIGINDTEVIRHGHIFKVSPNQIEQFYETLETYRYNDDGTENFQIITERQIILDIIHNIFNLLKVVGFVILLITAIEVTASVSNLNRVYFTERAGEFALLQSVGYSEKFVLKRMLKELSIIILVGLTGGIIIGQLTMTLFYYIYCFDKGIPYRLFEPNLILLASFLTFCIFLLSYFPVKKYIRKMDWVEVIQQSNI